jgi:hypothetical protein
LTLEHKAVKILESNNASTRFRDLTKVVKHRDPQRGIICVGDHMRSMTI